MISISFHSDYLAFVSLNVNNRKKNIEQLGILYYSVIFDNMLINAGKLESFFNVVLNKLKNSLDYYDNEFYISIPTSMVLLDINKINSNVKLKDITKLNELAINAKYGYKTAENFDKKTYSFSDDTSIKALMSVYFFKNCIAEIERIFKIMGLKLKGINVNIFSALNVVYELHKNKTENFSLFSFNDNNEIEFLHIEDEIITTYLRFKKYSGRLIFYAKNGSYSEELIELLNKDFGDFSYSLMGEIYLIGTKKNQEKIKYYANNSEFVNVVNPFDERIKENKLLVVNNLPSYFYNNNMFVEATGTIF